MKWYDKYLSAYEKPLDEIPEEVFGQIRQNMQRIKSDTPVVTVSVIGYNEERHLAACLWSLSEMQCKYPVEIIGVNNDSTDRTAEIFERCGVEYHTELQHSCGFARLCGLNHAKGRYHINIDSDTMYPKKYVEIMVSALERKGVVGVSSLWSYIPDKAHPWLGVKMFEFLRDTQLWMQHFKRPELSVRGLVFAFDTEAGKKVGIRTDIIRGEDGSLALGLKRYGKIVFIRNRKARAVTGYGTVGADGSFWNSFKVRAVKGLKGMGRIFTSKSHYQDEESNLIGKK